MTAPEFFEVEKMSGGLLFGSLRPGPEEGTLEVVADWGTETVPLLEVARIQLVKSSFWSRFKGSIDVGGSYTSASELLQLELDGNLRFRRPKFEAKATANAVADPAAGRGRHPAELPRPRLHAPVLQPAPASSPGRPSSRTASSASSCAAACWAAGPVRSLRDARNELVGGAGLSVNREKPVEGETTTNLEAAAGFDYANFAYDFPNTDIQVAAMGYLGLSQWGRYRLESSASLRRELFSDFYFGLRGYASYDSEPATEGAQKSDWGLTLTLGYSF